jgi:hypothetical protein
MWVAVSDDCYLVEKICPRPPLNVVGFRKWVAYGAPALSVMLRAKTSPGDTPLTPAAFISSAHDKAHRKAASLRSAGQATDPGLGIAPYSDNVSSIALHL